MRWRAAWSRQSRSTRIVFACAVMAMGLLIADLVAVGLDSAEAQTNPAAGALVPSAELQMINSAAASCPALTPPRLAGQLMENSGFNVNAVFPGGGSGISGLTNTAWKRWAPGPGAKRSSARDNIVALAHNMCDLVGEVRAAHLGVDAWRLALAAFVVGADQVVKTSGVPTGAAADYVAKVEAYTNWYQVQRQFGGPGTPSPSVSAAAAPATAAPATAAKPVPDEYLQPLLAAGTVCPAVTAPKLAAQLMAQSGFNPNKLSAAGQEGIAQFRAQTWAYYNLTPLATPWDANEAILVLGRAMCDLADQVSASNPGGDSYAGALTAFDWGLTSVAAAGGVPTDPDRSFLLEVSRYVTYYAADPRLAASPTASPTPPQPTTLTPSQPPPLTTPPTMSHTVAPGARSAYDVIQAESYSAQSGTQLEECADTGGGTDVGNIAAGDWLSYAKVDFGGTGATRFYVRFAADLPAGMSGLIEVRLDSLTSTPVGSAAVASTGGWQSWLTAPANIAQVTGVHDVYLTFVSSNGWEIGNINWITFAH